MVFSLVYSSTTDHDWSQDELLGLLEWSRAWNTDNAVTGLLMYRDCAFMQFLEGDEPTVRNLFSRISRDRRHQDIDLMWTHEAEQRRFGEWTMAFRELVAHPVEAPGYDDAFNEPSDGSGGVLVDFLGMFRAD